MLHRLNHWNYIEAKEAFNLTLDEWLFLGGYPGALRYKDDIELWSSYIRDSLIETAFLLSGLEQFKSGSTPKKGSSPKLILWNNALVNAATMARFHEIRNNHEKWGRLVENAAGSSFLNNMGIFPYRLFYWRKRNSEIDFVLASPEKIIAVEVKSSRMKRPHGLEKFMELYPNAKPLIIGGNGIELEKFFTSNLNEIIP